MSEQRHKTIIDLLGQDLTPEELETQVFDLLLTSLEPSVAEALSRCALPHWFDESILATLLDDKILSPAAIIQQVADLSFVRPRDAGGYLLHEEVRARFLQPWHTEKPGQCRALSQRLWQYFSQLAGENDAPFIIHAEALYHDLAANPEEAFPRFQKEFDAATDDWRLAQAEHLLQLAREQYWALGKEAQLWLAYHQAELALQSSDYGRALNILSELSSQSLPNELRGRVLSGTGTCLRRIGRTREAEQCYKEALTIQRDLDDAEGLAGTLDQLADFHLLEQKYDQALDYAQKAWEIVEYLKDERRIASVLRGIGAIYRQSGDEKKALEYYEKSLEIRRALNDEWGISDCLNSLAFIHRSQGEYDQALANLRQALETSERLGDLEGAAIQFHNIANLYLDQKEYEEALSYLRQGLDIAERIGSLLYQANILFDVARVYRFQDAPKHAQALEAYGRALALKEQAEDVLGQGVTLHAMGNVYQAQGEHAQALEAYGRALALKEQAEDVLGQGVTLHAMGNVYQAQGEHAQALEAYGRALALLEQAENVLGQGVTTYEMGKAYKKQGDFERALDYLKQSLNYFRRADSSRGEAFAAWHIGEIYEQQGRLAEAIELMELRIVYNRNIDDPEAKADAQHVEELRRRLQDRG